MKIFAVITIIALVGGSNAFLSEVSNLFHNLGQELGAVGKDLVHVAEPVANSLLQTLEKAGTQLLTTAASDLLSHLGGAGKRDLGEVISKIGSFVTKGEEYLKTTGTLLEGAFKGTIAKVHDEINSVMTNAKPLEKLVDEVKAAVSGHNEFVNNLVSKAEEEAMKMFGDIMHPKRDLAETAHTFGQGLKDLLQQVAAPLKSALGDIVTKLETNVLSLLG
ncbi:uncharacterized protein LOC135479894 [Liolophura sinensis]|uniref:uncharacterized protein LOC135479894 n=1 Tax=Liolophura sinensis TaxID=3198878 RepID=UPI003158B97E